MSLSATRLEQRYNFQGVALTIASDDAGIADALDRRLGRYRGAGGTRGDVRITYGCARGPFSSAVFHAEDARAVYDTPDGSILYSPSGDALTAIFAGVDMEASLGSGEARIRWHGEDPHARYLAAHPLTMVALCETLKRHRRFNLHAGCLAGRRRAALVAGQSGTGKSTLALALASLGLDFLADDMVFLSQEPEGVLAHGFADAIGVLPTTAGCIPELGHLACSPPPPGHRKHLIRIEEHLAAAVVAQCRPDFLVFPEIVDCSVSELVPMDPAEAWLRLIPDILLTDYHASERHLAVVARLTEQATCLRLRFGADVFAGARLVAELLT